MKKLLLTSILLMYLLSSFAQNKFRYTRDNHDGLKETIFTIYDIVSEQQKNAIIAGIKQINGVKDVKIFYKKRCKVTSEKDLNLYDVRAVLNKQNSDLDINYCVITDSQLKSELLKEKKLHPEERPVPVPASEWKFPEDFPKQSKFKNQKDFAQAKQLWIEQHPEQWKQITGVEYLDFSINLGHKKY